VFNGQNNYLWRPTIDSEEERTKKQKNISATKLKTTASLMIKLSIYKHRAKMHHFEWR